MTETGAATVPLAITTAGPAMTDVARRRKLAGESSVLTELYVPLWRQGGITLATLELDSLDDAALLLAEIDESSGALHLAGRSQADASGDAVQIVLAPSALAFAGADMAYLWAGLGAAVCCLAYNLRNPFCDGIGESRDGGLSAAGRRLVRCLGNLGVIIDVSHMSDASFADLVEATDGPIVASHSNARALCANPRNLTDAQASEIAARGGIVAVSVHPTLLAERDVTVETYVDHICHFVELVGVDHVGMGADFIGYALDIVAPKLAASDPTSQVYRADSLVAPNFASYEDLRQVPILLRERGMTEGEVRGIACDNYLRVLGALG